MHVVHIVFALFSVLGAHAGCPLDSPSAGKCQLIDVEAITPFVAYTCGGCNANTDDLEAPFVDCEDSAWGPFKDAACNVPFFSISSPSGPPTRVGITGVHPVPPTPLLSPGTSHYDYGFCA